MVGTKYRTRRALLLWLLLCTSEAVAQYHADDLAEDSPQDKIVLEWLFFAMLTVIAAFTIIDN